MKGYILNYNRIYLILAILVIANLFFPFLPFFLNLLFGLGLLFLASYSYGYKQSPEANNFYKLSRGLLNIFVILAIIGSIFFYFFTFSKLAIIIAIIIIFLKTKNIEIPIKIKSPKFPSFSLLIYYILSATLLYYLIQNVNHGLIKSPWLELPSLYLPLFFITTIFLIIIIRKKILQIPVAIHFFIFFSVAGFVYTLGYGFDQFIHEATQKYILEHGTITPKPTQYIGLYSINIFLHYITGIKISFLNRFLLPLLTILIAPIIFTTLKQKEILKSPLPLLSLLLLPFSYFIVTTPQGIANLFLLLLIFLSLNTKKITNLALATILIHPISGIAAFIYLAITKIKNKKIVLPLSIFILPAAFAFISYQFSGTLNFHFHLKDAFLEYKNLLLFGGIKQNYNFWLDLFYFSSSLLLPTIIIVSIFSAFINKKNISLYPLYTFFILTFSFFITSTFIDFSYLIDYEQKNYSTRIFYISLLFLSPYLIIFIKNLNQKILTQKLIFLKIFFTLLFAFLITSNLYLAYPRYDNYQNDKGKNITNWMLDAVLKIKDDAKNNDYVVLTDQTISSAALKIDGFKKYFQSPLGEVFYYPIPTGGPLYNEFLNLVYNNAGINTIKNASILTGTKNIYIALPSYWENSKKIKEKLKQSMNVLYEDKDIVILK